MARLPSTLITTILVLSGCGSPEQEPLTPTPGTPTLRVVTYNVNYGLAGDEATLEALRSLEADLVVLQETTPAWESVIRAELDGVYQQMLFHHSSGAGGLAVLSRYPVREREVIEAPSEWFPAWRLEVEGPLGRTQLLAVHLHPPVSDSGSVVSGYFTTPSVRQDELAEYLEQLEPSLPTIIAGDFNERDGQAMELLRRRGFRSALPAFQGRQRTWRWTTSVGEVSSQLDHIAHDDRLRPLNAQVIETGRSDHFPVMVTFELAEP